MPITKISGPSDWGRTNDTNRLTYKFSSNKWTEPNFQFNIGLKVYDADGVSTNLGNYNLYPVSGGTCEFNPAQIYKNFTTFDFNASTTTLEEATNMAKQFQLSVNDFFGTPPKIDGNGNFVETVKPVFYNGCQQNIPYDYMALNAPLANLQWVISGGTTGGTFLTDADKYYLDNDDLAFLYFLCPTTSRPTKIRYSIYYTETTAVQEQEIEPISALAPVRNQAMANIGTNQINTGPPITIIQPHLVPLTRLTLTTRWDTNVSYAHNYSVAHYFPMGPKNLIDNAILSGITDTWVYYRVDLCDNVSYNDYCYSNTTAAPKLMPVGSMIYEAQNEGVFALISSGGTVLDGDVTHPGTGPWSHRSGPIYYSKTASGTRVLNTKPFFVYKKPKCDKYTKWQLFWLNPHGGFDNYTFDKIKDIDYNIERTTYKQRLPTDSYSTYDAGEKIFDIKVEEIITLRTGLLTQLESQLIMQLVQSPVVYGITTYYYNDAHYPYGVPYIVVTDAIRYGQKNNTKEVMYEIQIRPANQKILQRN